MTWYRTGTVSVTNGSAVITGAGTDFVANVSPGEAFIGPDLRVYEIAAVVSATALTVVGTYQGGSASGQPYVVLPTQSFARDLALGAAELLATFSAVRDGIGQGLIADGTVAAPGIRFAGDQDTGLWRYGVNAAALVAGGVPRLSWSNDGVGVGRTAAAALLNIEPETTISGYHLQLINRYSTGAAYRPATIAMGVETPHVLLQAYANANNNTPGNFYLSILGADGVMRGRLVLDTNGNAYSPFDNAQSLGVSANRWSVVYAGTGSINTSDERYKQDIEPIPAAWLDAWSDVQWCRFRFRDAAVSKGDDARWHLGLIAQQVRAAFAAHGIDAQAIGLLCYDIWEAEAAVKETRDDDDNVVTSARPGRSAGDRWGLRYDECQAIEAAWQRRRIDQLEARLAGIAE